MSEKISFLWDAPHCAHSFRTAVSLHGHTQHSRESLDFIPAFASRHAVLKWALGRQERRCTRIKADLTRAYWTPPLTPRGAYDLEREQVEQGLNLTGLVSLTDHDNIEASSLLQLLPEGASIPISLEWTVPLAKAEIHLGVHNLPANTAADLVARMNHYTSHPEERALGELLGLLHESPEVLLVLNHPLWDLGLVGAVRHRRSVEDFLRRYNGFLHAFEVNGLRGWNENQAVMEMAHVWNRPLVSGGDRHGREPNAVVNLTQAATFSEFVEEIRLDGRSHLLFMPQYRQSVVLRMFHTFLDVIDDNPISPLGRNWDDRVFHPDADGIMQPVSSLWPQPPNFIKTIFSLARRIEAGTTRWSPRFNLDQVRSASRLPLRPGGEAA